jgi:hypothetical protein
VIASISSGTVFSMCLTLSDFSAFSYPLELLRDL